MVCFLTDCVMLRMYLVKERVTGFVNAVVCLLPIVHEKQLALSEYTGAFFVMS